MGVFWTGDFEKGDLTGWYWHQNKPEVVRKSDGHPVRAGNYSMRSYLHRRDSQHSYRTEAMMCPSDDAPEGTHAAIMLNNFGGRESEYWIGFSVYIPPEFVIDIERLTDIIFQVHGKPDKAADGTYLEPYRNPILAFEINANKWRVWNRWDDAATAPADHAHDNVYEAPLGASIGAWIDWVINVRWDWRQDGDGFLRIWRNGELWIDQDGPNCFNDQRGPHIAMGLYKWAWKETHDYPSNTDERVFYHDEFRMGDIEASYADVAPGGVAPEPPEEETVILHHGESHTFADLEPGDYLVSGNVPAGWTLAQNDFEITLVAGDNMVVAFQYSEIVEKASITVSVETDTGDTVQEFEITLTKAL